MRRRQPGRLDADRRSSHDGTTKLRTSSLGWRIGIAPVAMSALVSSLAAIGADNMQQARYPFVCANRVPNPQ